MKPAFVGICGSDLHEYEDGPHIIPPHGEKHSMTGEGPPVILGHEFSAVVEEVGEGVEGFKKGDKVCIQPTIYDANCRACDRGLTNSCDSFGFIGLSGWGGGMSEYTTAPAEYVKKLPDDMSLEIGALVEPLAVGWHAVSTSPYQDGDSVLVLGGGPIGLAVILALLAKGCKNIICAEVRLGCTANYLVSMLLIGYTGFKTTTTICHRLWSTSHSRPIASGRGQENRKSHRRPRRGCML